MRVRLIEVAEEEVEALARGDARRAFVPEPPLADQARRVTGAAENLGDRQIFGPEVVLAVAANVGVAGVQARHEYRARGGADGRTRVELREAHPFPRHAVEVRRPDPSLAVAPEVAVAEVVGEDENDVRALEAGRTRGRERVHRSGE